MSYRELLVILPSSTNYITLQQIDEIKKLESESAKKDKRTEYGIKEMDNPLFELSIDLYRYYAMNNL